MPGKNIADKKLAYVFRRADLEGEVTFLRCGEIIVHRTPSGVISATINRCRHQGGRFQYQGGCVLTCPRHGWQLDVSKMTYVSPTGNLGQEKLFVEETPDGEVRLYEPGSASWQLQCQDGEPLDEGEFTIRFYAHACVEICCGGKSLFTDPWLTGPAFIRGWWLMHQPPVDWLDRLASADAIYISHNHSDHLNLHTLRRLAARNPNVCVYVPEFDNDTCPRLVRRAGLQNVTELPFGQWFSLDDFSRFMILPDATGRDDSGLLVEYKGHRVLNTVDCHNLCNGQFPQADVLMTSFAGGASGYPVCWEAYSEDRITGVIQKKRQQELVRVIETAKKVRPKVYVPFAGYFTEAHPSDADIRWKNVKNTPEIVSHVVLENCPDTEVWIPQPGDVFDIATSRAHSSCSHASCGVAIHDFAPFLNEISESRDFLPLQTLAGVESYFRWAGFRADLVLHVLETSEDFQRVLREFYVDFLDLSFPSSRPLRSHRYLRMKCRSDVFRYALRNGISWEEISIGFQARFYREPDVYNFDFWDYFQNHLPIEPPDWSQWENAG